MAVITGDSTLIPFADKALVLIKESVDENGWLRNTVNPYTFTTASTPEENSPEGQAFVLLLQAAWRDWFTFFTNSGASLDTVQLDT